MLKISTTPHLSAKQDTRKIMRDVIVALFPAMFAALLLFGLNALIVLATSVTSCLLFEYLLSRALRLKNNTWDLSAVVTGVLLALNLPATMPIWMTMVGAFMAIGVAKMAFGGIGKNIFNPALVGRVFLFISFPVQMTSWVLPQPLDFFKVDAATSATALNVLKHIDLSGAAEVGGASTADMLPSYAQMFWGNMGGSMGEVSVFALLLGFYWLLHKNIIGWQIPVVFVGTFAFLMGLTYLVTANPRYEMLAHVMSGGLLLGAIFMATDYTTSPMTVKGKVIFAAGCGALTYVIRAFSAYPEGVSFAILIMNAFVPLIDKYCVQYVYGSRRK